MIEMKIEGVDEVIAAIEKWEGVTIQALTKAVDETKEDLLSKSQKLAPHDKGDLEGSGTPGDTIADMNKREISATVGFHRVYAARMHESYYTPGPITASQPSVDGMRPGRKYLERPLVYYFPAYVKSWADAIRAVTGG